MEKMNSEKHKEEMERRTKERSKRVSNSKLVNFYKNKENYKEEVNFKGKTRK